jgi:hypothetical protein
MVCNDAEQMRDANPKGTQGEAALLWCEPRAIDSPYCFLQCLHSNNEAYRAVLVSAEHAELYPEQGRCAWL